MVTLEEYLKESLLDDFDTLDQSAHNGIIDQLLSEIDSISGQSKSKYQRNAKIVEPSKIENDNLVLVQYDNYDPFYYTAEIGEKLKQIYSINGYKKIIVPRGLYIADDVIKLDNSITKEFELHDFNILLSPNIELIKNLTFRFAKGTSSTARTYLIDGRGTTLSSWRSSRTRHKLDPLVFQNCNIYNELSNKRSLLFVDIPVFNNCKVTRIEYIHIQGILILKDRKANLAKFENMVVPTHQAMYTSAKTGAWDKINKPDTWTPPEDNVVKKMTFKQLYACLNNPKKYNFVASDYGDTMFKINPKFKLKDIIDISGFDDSLAKIIICDHNVAIQFYRPDSGCGRWDYHCDGIMDKRNDLPLPNDEGWRVVIYKRKIKTL